ncbi:MAG: GspE/PulE family protein [bacterium]|nr:GspE/PulE family protein [bacterium]
MPDVIATPAVALVDRLLRNARERGASDLHLDPGEDGMRVRIRRDGALHTLETLPAELSQHVVGRCKSLAELLVYRRDVPQEGRIGAERSGIGCELRVATYPTLFGERVALRLDAPDGSPCALAELGLEEPVAKAIHHAIEQPDGVVLLTGPSGSGKTTTLYSCLRHLVDHGPERTIVTVEDPVERRLDGVVQTEVDAAAGLDFTRALRSLLRQDPDVLLVGEIRDRETAAIALEAGLTGHLVASTLHAGSAAEVFARLLEMGVEPFVLTTTIRGVLAQRLLRRKCAAAGDITSDKTSCDDDCDLCQGSGYAGRQLVAEWLPMGPDLRQAVLDRGDGDALAKAAANSGFSTLRAAAERLVERGITDTREVERVLGTRRQN